MTLLLVTPIDWGSGWREPQNPLLWGAASLSPSPPSGPFEVPRGPGVINVLALWVMTAASFDDNHHALAGV